MRTRSIALALAVIGGLGLLTHVTKAAITHNRLATNRLATNRLATNRLATNRLATNRLATNALSSSTLEASQASLEMLSTADGRELFSYLVSCALGPEVTIQALLPNAPDSAPPDTNYSCLNGVCSFEGTNTDPMTGKASIVRMVSQHEPDREVHEMHGPGPDGKVFKMMELVYSRAK